MQPKQKDNVFILSREVQPTSKFVVGGWPASSLLNNKQNIFLSTVLHHPATHKPFVSLLTLKLEPRLNDVGL